MAIVTICSDASYSPTYKIGTWACYIRTPSRTIKKAGLIKGRVENSVYAERVGINNALFIVNKLVDLSKYKLILYCDNEVALNDVKVKVTPKSKHYQKQYLAHKFYENNIKPYLQKAMSYETRHVKGHLPESEWNKDSKRNLMNQQCDTMAHGLLRKETRRIKRGL